VFSLMCGRQIQNITYTQKQAWSYTNSYVQHVYNSGTTLWFSGKEGKEKGMIEHQQIS
jgi:hypothetical protein